MDVRAGQQKWLSTKELMHSNCGAGEDFWESLDCKKIKPVNPKGNQTWIFIGRTDAEAEVPTLRPPDVKSWLIWKGLDAGKGLRQKEKGATEDEMAGWHHWPTGHELEQTLGDGEGQGSLVCCSPGGCKDLDTTKWLKARRYSAQNSDSFIDVDFETC